MAVTVGETSGFAKSRDRSRLVQALSAANKTMTGKQTIRFIFVSEFPALGQVNTDE
jgi:hypothetical protein